MIAPKPARWPPGRSSGERRRPHEHVAVSPLKMRCKRPGPPLAGTPMAKRKPNAAFMKPVQPDAVLAVVVGSKPLPRTELTKKLWLYIKKHGLQNKKVKTQIDADDALKAVFGGKKSVSMFEMTKLVSGHVKA